MSNAPKPIVGVTGDFRPERYNGAALSWFNAGYYDSVIGAGGVPMMLPPYDNDDDLKQAMSLLGGIVLAGSTLDLDPDFALAKAILATTYTNRTGVSLTASAAPGPRGPDPSTSTTLARATRVPATRQRSRSSSSSLMVSPQVGSDVRSDSRPQSGRVAGLRVERTGR